MANKPASRNWNDIQVAIATISMAFTLVFWNLFAGPDRVSALKRTQEQTTLPPLDPTAESSVVVQPTPLGDGKILLGGHAPVTTIIVQAGGGGGGGGRNRGGGGGVGGGGGGGGTGGS